MYFFTVFIVISLVSLFIFYFIVYFLHFILLRNSNIYDGIDDGGECHFFVVGILVNAMQNQTNYRRIIANKEKKSESEVENIMLRLRVSVFIHSFRLFIVNKVAYLEFN